MAKTRLLKVEKEHHVQAFEAYHALGPGRSHQAVAKQFGVSIGSVKNWSRSFRWQERIAEREADVARTVASRNLNEEVSRRERNDRIVQMALIRLAKAIADGHVKMTLSDLDRLIRLESYLHNGVDSRQEIIIGDLKDKSDQELREMVREEMKLLGDLDVRDVDCAETERSDDV